MEKKEKVVTKSVSKEEKINKLIRKRAYKLFDREPNGSLVDGQVGTLTREIANL